MWVLTYKGTKKIHLIGHGPFDPTVHDMAKLDYIEVPDQPITHLFKGDPPILDATLDDLILYSPEKQIALMDRDTGRKINAQMHPFVSVEEQIGILRDQIVCILNALGIEPTEEFTRLNEIAIREIEAAREKKEALDA